MQRGSKWNRGGEKKTHNREGCDILETQNAVAGRAEREDEEQEERQGSQGMRSPSPKIVKKEQQQQRQQQEQELVQRRQLRHQLPLPVAIPPAPSPSPSTFASYKHHSFWPLVHGIKVISRMPPVASASVLHATAARQRPERGRWGRGE